MMHVPMFVYQPTCFGGLLVRTIDGWMWTDGSPEPAIGSVASRAADLVCRAEVEPRLVEVPYRLSEWFDPLGWVHRGATAGLYDIDVSSGSFPALGRQVGSSSSMPSTQRRRTGVGEGIMVVLVPLPVWRTWCGRCPVLPTWSSDDDQRLEARAGDLGWRIATPPEVEETREAQR